MSTRISSARSPLSVALAALLLAGCGEQAPEGPVPGNAQTRADANSEERIACAAPGESTFSRSCVVERQGAQLTLRHADGGFRRLLVAQDGRGVIAADGAERAEVTPLGPDSIEVALGGARYRLPATVRQ